MGIGSAIVKGITKIAKITGPKADNFAANASNVTKSIDDIVAGSRPIRAIGATDDIIQGSPILKYLDETPGAFKIFIDNVEKISKMGQKATEFLSKYPDMLVSILKSSAKIVKDELFDLLEKAAKFRSKAAKNVDDFDDAADLVVLNPRVSPAIIDEAPGIVNGAGRLAPSADDALKFGDAFKAAVRRKFPDFDTKFIDDIETSVKKLPPLEGQKVKSIIKKLQDGKALNDIDTKALEDFISKVQPGGIGAMINRAFTGATDAIKNATWKQIAVWGLILGMGMYFVIKLIMKSEYRGTITEIKYDVKTWEENGVFVNHTPGMDINRKDEIIVAEAKIASVNGTFTAKTVSGPTQYVLFLKPSGAWPGDCTTSPCGKIYIKPNFFATAGEVVGDTVAGVAGAAGAAAKGLFDGLLDGLGLGDMRWLKWVCLALIILSSASVTIGLAMQFM